MDLTNKKVVVMGAGKSGMAAVGLLCKVGACPVLYDENKDLNKEEVANRAGLSKDDIYAGTLPEAVFAETELLVMSPGIPVDTDFVARFREKSIPVWGEIELAYAYAGGKVIAITGTNGKTTTTALTGKIVEDFHKKVFVVGNIGNPYTEAALQIGKEDITVAEVSSFQLETIENFRPAVSAVLNITPDHLNRHHTMENYIKCKEDVAKNQTKSDICVLNYEDAVLRDFANRCNAKVVFFSSERELEEGVFLKQEDIYQAKGGVVNKLMNIHEMRLLGTHNVENVMAAIAMTDAIGIPMENIIASVKDFKAVEHRIEYVATINGVDYYNDSKGTNPDAAIKGIQAMNRPTVLIGGGYDKDSTYDEWIESFQGKVTWLVLLGQTKEKIAACAKEHGFHNIVMVSSMEEAVEVSASKAENGHAVLLSPACASWGMFTNYEVRGNVFKELVRAMEV